jgi:hypothetical protein
MGHAINIQKEELFRKNRGSDEMSRPLRQQPDA